VFSGLVCESEESEKDKGADDGAPAGQLEGGLVQGIEPPQDGGDLVHTVVSPMDVGEALVGDETERVDIEVEDPRSEGDGADDFDSGKGHQTEVSARVEVVGA